MSTLRMRHTHLPCHPTLTRMHERISRNFLSGYTPTGADPEKWKGRWISG